MSASASPRSEAAAARRGARDAPARKLARAPLLAAGAVSLLAGMWAGLRRAGWDVPLAFGMDLADHAALMVSGFLGTLIALERAVALRLPWTFLAPALSGLAGVGLLLGLPRAFSVLLFALAGGVLTLGYLYVLRLQPATFTTAMAAGAGAWLLGTLAWGGGLPAATWTTGWAAFLVLTIVGERLELSRLTRLPRAAWTAFSLLVAAHGAAVGLSVFEPSWGFRLAGLVFVGWAVWLARHDVARRTVRTPGLPRFAAVGLLTGYGWLLVAGLLWAAGPTLPAGLRYDAQMHALFLGFVFSMVFAHAPIIWPSVLGGEIRFFRRFYAHLGLLHLSLLMRVGADLAGWEDGRRWAVVLNTVAIVIFLVNTAVASRPSSPAAHGRR
ncbi:MAG: hypothetical protein QN193_10885 [Armatimonadota bacterium]|nr:hypothetical protein [Armatimonadota bacterium]MDR7445193.1 hypothetical protein [Armatimonadota bacterium]MDR7571098.1 hypothetical protein [Armatimonadota bacterium]MDR7613706.1 hypothetical protein [Armatimonadota bacterium]